MKPRVIAGDPLANVKQKRLDDLEIYGPILLMDTVGLVKLESVYRENYARMYAKMTKAKNGRWLARLAGMGSDNVPVIDATLDLWLSDVQGALAAAREFDKFFDLQSRLHEPRSDDERRLTYFQVDEPYSANYGGWCFACYILVWEWARRNGMESLQRKAEEHINQTCIAYGLMSVAGVPGGAPIGIARNSRGHRYDDGQIIWTPPVGQRSNTAHTDSGIRLMLEMLVYSRFVRVRRPNVDWFLEVAQRVQPPVRNAREIIRYLGNPSRETASELAAHALFRIYSPQRVYRWADIHVVSLDEWRNKNTTAFMAFKTNVKTGEYEAAFPFPEGRGFGLSGAANSRYIPERAVFEITTTNYKNMALGVPPGQPEYSIVVGEDGVSVS